MRIFILSTTFLLLWSTNSSAAQELPNYRSFYNTLQKKVSDIKREAVYNTTKKPEKKAKRNLFRMKVGSKNIDYSKLDAVVLPVDPLKFDCSHTNISRGMPTDPRFRKGSIKSALSWAKDYLFSTKPSRSGPVEACNKGMWNLMKARCMDSRDPEIARLYVKGRTHCRRVFKRYWIEETYRAEGKEIPLWAVDPSSLTEQIASKIRWGENYLKTPSKWYSYMIEYLDILSIDPKNRFAKKGFDIMYSSYFGVSQDEARKARKSGILGGPLSTLPKSDLYKKAINELLGKHHTVSGNIPTLGLTYRDVNYLLTMVYLPAIRRNQNQFASLKCSINLRKAMKDFREKAVAEEMKLEKSRFCYPSSLTVTGSDVMRHPTIRLKLIEILSKQTDTPADVYAEAAKTVARQVGAKKSRVCWLHENPYPESIKPSAGKNANCSSFGHSGYHNVRPGFYNYVYEPVKLKTLTYLQVKLARKLIKDIPSASGLDGKLAKVEKRAKKEQCLAWDITIAWDYFGRGKWGKPYRYSNGGPKEVSCGSFSRSGLFSTVFKAWNNFFDTVFGGKFTGGERIIRRRYSGVIIRKTREGRVFVKRKI